MHKGPAVRPMRRKLQEEPKEPAGQEVARKMLRAGKILERMVTQNTSYEIARGEPDQ